MSVFRLTKFLFSNTNIAQNAAILNHNRYLSVSVTRFCAKTPSAEDIPEVDRSDKDRTRIIPVETSIKYLNSEAYKTTYGDQLVWQPYRRNHKCQFAPRKTRQTCIRKGFISTGNPCPICRDEYLVVDYRNLGLLNQFISPQTGEILSYSKTGVCQKKHNQLVIAIEKAMDYGLISFKVPFKEYDYEKYYGKATDSQA
ncbi:hypothetical protein HA402_005984 [Bradysia odoriphaga]|nr:hypothetical protein HA402_005984 [Bradysia odoriphaga]